MIQIVLWLPLATGLACLLLPRRTVPVLAALGLYFLIASS